MFTKRSKSSERSARSMNKTFEEIIAEQGRLVYTSVGDSMSPLIRENDLLVIEPVKEPLEVGDIPLYKRDSGQYVLHRIVKIKNGKYTMKGDNRDFIEKGITDRHIIGVLTQIVRSGKTFPVETPEEYALRTTMVWLVSCAVNEEKPDSERIKTMELRGVLDQSQRHMLSAAVAFALEEAIPLPYAFDQVKKNAIRRLALFEVGRAAITSELEKAGIQYLPLKGILIKDDYPKSSMREMTDNDILVDSSRIDEVVQIMKRLGYSGGEYQKDHDVVFTKPPSLVFEMHNRLFENPLFNSYYQSVWEKAIPIQGTQCGFQMTDKDFYLYLICHMYKHYIYMGIGLRSLLDVYVFYKSHCGTLDRAYLDEELKKLKLTDFERDVRILADKAFTGSALSQREQAELERFADAGVLGTEERALQSDISKYYQKDGGKKSVLNYYFRRAFVLSEKDLEKHFPFFYRHKILLPALPFYRLTKGVIKHPKHLVSEYKTVKQIKPTNSDRK